MATRIRQWIDSNSVVSCYQCGVVFSMFVRKHHCRFCGRVFCGSCTSQKMAIPSLLRQELPLSPSPDNYLTMYLKSHDENRPRRLCEECQQRIHITKSVEQLLRIVLCNQYLTWEDYARMAMVNNQWHTGVQELRRLLYGARDTLPSINLTPLERQLVALHASYLYSHPKWKVTVLRVLRRPPMRIFPTPCTWFQCNCATSLLLADAIESVMNWFHLEDMMKFAVTCFSSGIPKSFLTILTFAATKSHAFFEHVVVPRLQSREFVHAFAFRSRAVQNLHLFQQLVQASPFQKELEASMELANVLLKLAATHVMEQRQTIVNAWQRGRAVEIPVYLVGNTDWLVLDIKWSKIVKKQSSTMPTLVPIMAQHARTKEVVVLSVLIKEESVLKDMVVMDVLHYISILYNKEVVQYHVMNLTPTKGMLIIVPDSRTLQSITTEKKLTIQNYLIEKNPQQTVDLLRTRFLESCVVASVLSHLCGLGDRHMENILLHRSGRLFHIDFGYIMGDEPAGKQHLSAVTMKLTPEILDAMGGEHSTYFSQFKSEVSSLYNLCRQHTKAFYYMMVPLLLAKVVSKEVLVAHVLEKFVPGETTREARVRIEECISRNTKERQLDYWFDVAHTIKSKWFQ